MDYVYGCKHDQKSEVEAYLDKKNINVFSWIKDEDCKAHWTGRQINKVLKTITKHDTLVVYEPANLACSTSQIIEILNIAASKNLAVHFVKYNFSLGNEYPEINTQSLLKLILKIESDFMSKRTTQASARRKEAGLPVGRPKGSQSKTLKLDKFKDEIEKYQLRGVSYASIAKLLDCHPQSLYDWLRRCKNRHAKSKGKKK